MTSNFIPSSVIYMEKLDSMRFWSKLENFAKSAQIWSQHVRLVLTKKTSTHTLCFWPWTTKLLGVESGQIMPHVRHCCWTSPDVNEPYAHRRCAWDERLIFYNITRCYGKRVKVFAVAIAAGDISRSSMEVLYGEFTWGIIKINIIFSLDTWDTYFIFLLFLLILSAIWLNSWVKVFRINPEFRILRLTFHRKKVSLKMLN